MGGQDYSRDRHSLRGADDADAACGVDDADAACGVESRDQKNETQIEKCRNPKPKLPLFNRNPNQNP